MVPGSSTRPVGERVKEALFGILGPSVVDARFLDLFAGTGSVGIEALSRGASYAVFVDQRRQAVVTIKENLALTGLKDRARVVRDDVFSYLKKEDLEPFDLIYVAPPQYKGLWVETLLSLDESTLLRPDGLVVAQIHPKEYVELELEALVLSQRRKYGSTLLCFYVQA
jgi:16S rRNA (guanine(966)-N(2))-methyltransferase RsmD